MLLVGDVGGTKTLLALYDEGRPAPVLEAELPSREFPTLEAVIARFLAGCSPVRIVTACFGVAGPVVDGRCVMTNLPWVLDEEALAVAIPAARVRLLNDLEAMGHGVLGLSPGALATLQPGTPRSGNLAVIAAGTGLGEALCVWDGARHVVVATEGSHADFAARNELEIELLRALRKEFGRVSWERVVSGPGLVTIYQFLRETGRDAEPPWLAARLEAEDPARVISEVGLEPGHGLCQHALEVFVSAYGAEAGNLALKALAMGGVFVAGGIAPKIASKLADGTFIAAFRDKGRFEPLMRTIPVHIVLEPRTGLIGAARVARALMP